MAMAIKEGKGGTIGGWVEDFPGPTSHCGTVFFHPERNKDIKPLKE
jgi:hypothetical protein